jgi:hypothetical protein
MPYVAAVAGLVLVLATLLDAFEVVLLPRPARHRLRLNHYFYLRTWAVWSRFAARWPVGRRREDLLGIFGPLSMVMLFAVWAACLIAGFGLLQWALQVGGASSEHQSLSREMILSGDAFFTLGYGDVVPRSEISRFLVIVEAGTGFGFIAITVGYLPVLYQHFADRDVRLIEFAARAGSPPTAASLLAWHGTQGTYQQLDEWLREWEHWAAELIESHSTYPMLAFYRSQHAGYSWLSTLAVILDSCTVIVAGADGRQVLQAAATFSAARRVLDEISRSLNVAPAPWLVGERRGAQSLVHLRRLMQSTVPNWGNVPDFENLVVQIQQSYEPELGGLSGYLLLPLPEWANADSGKELFAKTRVVETLLMRTPRRDG